jgi:hypothetical protein
MVSTGVRGSHGVTGTNTLRTESGSFGGWAAYFRVGNSTQMFDKVERYAVMRVAGFIAKRHRRRARYGWRVLRLAPTRPGLVTRQGCVVAPRPLRPWRALVTAHRR